MARIHRFEGFSRLLTITYWRTRLALLWGGRPLLNIQEVVIGEISEEELEVARDNNLDTSDYILLTGR